MVGGTGRIGSRVVAALRARGHDVLALARSTGFDTVVTPLPALEQALAGVRVVVDTTRPPGAADDAAVHAFFTTSTSRLLEAGRTAGVGHHVLLTSVGSHDRSHPVPYYRAKAEQAHLVRTCGLPFTVVAATQFFEFVTTIADVATREGVVRLPGALSQPIAGADVATAVVSAAVENPLQDDREIAGPEQFPLDELVRRVLSHRGDRRRVVLDDGAPYFGAVIARDTLLPREGAAVAPTVLEDWLGRQP